MVPDRASCDLTPISYLRNTDERDDDEKAGNLRRASAGIELRRQSSLHQSFDFDEAQTSDIASCTSQSITARNPFEDDCLTDHRMDMSSSIEKNTIHQRNLSSPSGSNQIKSTLLRIDTSDNGLDISENGTPKEQRADSMRKEKYAQRSDSNPSMKSPFGLQSPTKQTSTRPPIFLHRTSSTPNEKSTPTNSLGRHRRMQSSPMATSPIHSTEKPRPMSPWRSSSPVRDILDDGEINGIDSPAAKYQLRSSEFDPTAFQIEIPSLEEVSVQSKICGIMGNLTKQYIDLSQLQGLSLPRLIGARYHGAPGRLKDTHKVDCARFGYIDDLIIEKVLRADNESGLGSIEVAVLNTQKARQLIVCFTGPPELQAKPVRSKKEVLADFHILHPKQRVAVHPAFRDAYFTKDLEGNLNKLINRLTAENPFFDVIFTGHSFGAALSIIGAARYAAYQPMIRVSCYAFGSPRVGGTDFRSWVHSLPNLKIVRMENRSDPYVNMPEMNGGWMHVGHTIWISSTTSKGKQATNVKAYKFDKRRRSSSILKTGMNAITKKGAAKNDHDISSYRKVLHDIKTHSPSFVKSFVGEEGKGVNGSNNEGRFVV